MATEFALGTSIAMADSTSKSRKRQSQDSEEITSSSKKAKTHSPNRLSKIPTTFLSHSRELRQAIPYKSFEGIVIADPSEWCLRVHSKLMWNWWDWNGACACLVKEQGRDIADWGSLLKGLHADLAEDVGYVVGKMMVKSQSIIALFVPRK